MTILDFRFWILDSKSSRCFYFGCGAELATCYLSFRPTGEIFLISFGCTRAGSPENRFNVALHPLGEPKLADKLPDFLQQFGWIERLGYVSVATRFECFHVITAQGIGRHRDHGNLI
jgi:hypothetical protein